MVSQFDQDNAHAFAVRLMQHLVVPTFVLDAQRRVLIWNKACERLTGVPAEKLIGTQDHWRAFYDAPRYCLADVLTLGCEETLGELYSEHAGPGESGNGLRAENWCTMPQIGSRLYLAIDAGPIFDDQGKLIAVVETLRDMTEQKNAQTALQNLAAHDGLTGIANRRAFDERLGTEWLRAARDRQSISLLLLDVDFFKRYNDAYGHQQGDECLRKVAEVMAGAVFRAADLSARYGGEEFVVLMPNTSARGAMAVAERVRGRIAGLGLPHAESDVADHVTASIGVATMYPAPGDLAADLVAAADSALYAAKYAGRNRVAVADVVDDMDDAVGAGLAEE
jgi:diguanylate cyclase (GGDEF)-like protein